jgi:hypothetical protein
MTEVMDPEVIFKKLNSERFQDDIQSSKTPAEGDVGFCTNK